MTHEEINIKVELVAEIVAKLFELQQSEQELLKSIMDTVRRSHDIEVALESRLNVLETVVSHPREVTFDHV